MSLIGFPIILLFFVELLDCDNACDYELGFFPCPKL